MKIAKSLWKVLWVVTWCTVGMAESCPDGGHWAGAAPPEGTERWCEKLDAKGNMVRHGPAKEWYLNGQVLSEGNNWNDRKTGQWTWYHPNGQKRQQGRLFDDRPMGRWSYWDENGKARAPIGSRMGAAPSESGPNLDDLSRNLGKDLR